VVDRANIGTHFFCTLFSIQKRSRFNSFARILNQKDILKSSQVAPSGIRDPRSARVGMDHFEFHHKAISRQDFYVVCP
jgi:hypothetical protein